MRAYTPEQVDFLREHCAGRSARELTAMFNERFGTAKTETAIKSAKSKYKCPRGPAFTDEQIQFIRDTYPGTPLRDMTDLFNRRFGTDKKQHSIAGAAYQRGIKNGIDTSVKITEAGKPYRFKPGQVSHNKGKKGYYAPGSEKGWFKPGNIPKNYKPVGSERICDGYIWVKVADPNKWREKHKLVWEAAHGPVPEGYCIIFADGNKQHTELENLLMITRSELARLNQNRLIYPNAKLTKAALNAIRLKMAAWEKERKKK